MTNTSVSPTPATEEKIAEDVPPAGSGWSPPKVSVRAGLVIALLAPRGRGGGAGGVACLALHQRL
ncbi:hypothetical protein AB5I41_13300 [Sphingomonas sp. MMS24-JH45]